MNIKYPDYSNSIANLACSILKYYGINPPNDTLAQADLLLHKEYKNVVLILLDGMGVHSLEKHLSENGFFRKYLIDTYSSTFPPTTVAATTAVDSGLFPNQSAWLGWTGYFEEIDKNVMYFLSIDNDTEEQLDFDVARTFVPYKNMKDRIGEVGINAYFVAPFLDPYPSNYGVFCEEVKKLCKGEERKYIYAYWNEPDYTMHHNGVDGDDITNILLDIESKTEQMARELENTLLIITADHGHINVKNEVITDYPDIMECLVRMPSMEVRALNFFVKEGMEEKFEHSFNKHFGEQFILFSKAEVLEKQLLGIGQNHKKLNQMLGDYLAIAIDEIAIINTADGYKGHHAGLTQDEMTNPLIAIAL